MQKGFVTISVLLMALSLLALTALMFQSTQQKNANVSDIIALNQLQNLSENISQQIDEIVFQQRGLRLTSKPGVALIKQTIPPNAEIEQWNIEKTNRDVNAFVAFVNQQKSADLNLIWDLNTDLQWVSYTVQPQNIQVIQQIYSNDFSRKGLRIIPTTLDFNGYQIIFPNETVNSIIDNTTLATPGNGLNVWIQGMDSNDYFMDVDPEIAGSFNITLDSGTLVDVIWRSTGNDGSLDVNELSDADVNVWIGLDFSNQTNQTFVFTRDFLDLNIGRLDQNALVEIH